MNPLWSIRRTNDGRRLSQHASVLLDGLSHLRRQRLLGVAQVVGHLQVHPEFRRRFKKRPEPDRGFPLMPNSSLRIAVTEKKQEPFSEAVRGRFAGQTVGETIVAQHPLRRSSVSCLSRWSGRWIFTQVVDYHGLGDPFTKSASIRRHAGRFCRRGECRRIPPDELLQLCGPCPVYRAHVVRHPVVAPARRRSATVARWFTR